MEYWKRIDAIEERNRRIKERISQLEARNHVLRQQQEQIALYCAATKQFFSAFTLVSNDTASGH